MKDRRSMLYEGDFNNLSTAWNPVHAGIAGMSGNASAIISQ